MFAADADEDSGNVTVLAIERKAALLVMPGQAGKAAFDGTYRQDKGANRLLLWLPPVMQEVSNPVDV